MRKINRYTPRNDEVHGSGAKARRAQVRKDGWGEIGHKGKQVSLTVLLLETRGCSDKESKSNFKVQKNDL